MRFAYAQRIALVIGNSKYQTESVLQNPVNDARLIAQTLRAQGFKVDEKFNLPRRDMELTINRFVRESAGAESAVLYYAGHGAQPLGGGRNFLLPVDAKVEGDDTLETDGIAADRIVEQMERNANPARLRLVVLDACRNNRLAGKARSSVRGLARMSPSDDYTLIAFSTNDQDVALDGSGNHSPYAEALARHLGRAGNTPLRRIFELTAEDVRKTTGQKQRPRTYGDLDSRMLLTGTLVPEPSPLVAPTFPAPLSAGRLEQHAWEAALKSGTVLAFETFLAEYPSGDYASMARVKLAALRSSQSTSGTGINGSATDSAHALIDNRYLVLSDGGEVKDVMTGLIWQRCSVGQRWDGVTCTGSVEKVVFGKTKEKVSSGWRIPSVRELHSLVSCSSTKTKGTEQLGDGREPVSNLCDGEFVRPTISLAAFPNTPLSSYWSSSVYSRQGRQGWFVEFLGGGVSYFDESSYGAVRLVKVVR